MSTDLFALRRPRLLSLDVSGGLFEPGQSDFVWEGRAAMGMLALLVIAGLAGSWMARRTGDRP